MKTRRAFLSMMGASAMIGAAVSFTTPAAAGPAPANAKVGEPAPDFTLKDAAGTKEYKLSDHKGKVVVLQWINPDCPICRRCVKGDVVRNMRAELKKLDPEIVHLAINSTHYMDPKKSIEYLEKNKIEIPALNDQDGTVGRIYGAKTTPHTYVIDAEGVLRYDGAIDDDPRGSNAAGATNYVVNAVRQVTAGETVSPDRTKPYGCSVKYAKGQGKGKGKGKGKQGGLGSGSGG